MDKPSLDFIEKYQLLLQKDPDSKAFAPLSEGYRKMGLLKQALTVSETGVKLHPNFTAGHLAFAQALLAHNRTEEAAKHLAIATQLSPENILAHSLLANSYLKLKNSKQAFNSFKMVLFLNPGHKRAQQAINKLESLTAKDFTEESFNVKPLKEVIKDIHNKNLDIEEDNLTIPDEVIQNKAFYRQLSLVDALISQNDFEKAQDALADLNNELGPSAEVSKRTKLINLQLNTAQEPDIEITEKPSRKSEINNNKLSRLNKILQKIEKHISL